MQSQHSRRRGHGVLAEKWGSHGWREEARWFTDDIGEAGEEARSSASRMWADDVVRWRGRDSRRRRSLPEADEEVLGGDGRCCMCGRGRFADRGRMA